MAMISRAENQRRMDLYKYGLNECSGCDEVLSIEQFSRNSRSWMGLKSRCITCCNAASLDYQVRTATGQAERQKRWRDENREAWLAISRRRDARKKAMRS